MLAHGARATAHGVGRNVDATIVDVAHDRVTSDTGGSGSTGSFAQAQVQRLR